VKTGALAKGCWAMHDWRGDGKSWMLGATQLMLHRNRSQTLSPAAEFITAICQLILSSSLLLWKTWEHVAHLPQTLSRPLVTKSAVCLVRKEKLHSCSSVCLWHCNDSMQFFCTTPLCSRTIRTNSHTSTVFTAFNPWELYTQGYKKISTVIIYLPNRNKDVNIIK